MSTALIGKHIPREGRTNAISYLMAGNALLYLVGMPLVNYIGDWRRSFMFFSVTILLISVVMSWILVPREETLIQSIDIFEGYKGIFSNKSAVASLLGNAFGSGIWIITLSLAFSFFREVFSMSRGSVVYLTFGTAGAYLVGAILSRRIIPKLGSKKTTMFSVVLMGIFTLVYLSGVSFLVSILGCLLVCFVAGVNASASQGLNLEQVPQFRGSMMSMVTAFGSVGYSISLAMGGFVLINYGWSTIGIVLTIFSFVGLLIINFFVEEPQ
jgi:predicted MFS family arabinose efflux permease